MVFFRIPGIEALYSGDELVVQCLRARWQAFRQLYIEIIGRTVEINHRRPFDRSAFLLDHGRCE
jgi:hypothetical protein